MKYQAGPECGNPGQLRILYCCYCDSTSCLRFCCFRIVYSYFVLLFLRFFLMVKVLLFQLSVRNTSFGELQRRCRERPESRWVLLQQVVLLRRSLFCCNLIHRSLDFSFRVYIRSQTQVIAFSTVQLHIRLHPQRHETAPCSAFCALKQVYSSAGKESPPEALPCRVYMHHAAVLACLSARTRRAIGLAPSVLGVLGLRKRTDHSDDSCRASSLRSS